MSNYGSYDTASETKMSQLLRAFAVGTRIILGHVAIMVKSNEIPAMQALVRELGLAEVLCTADAMHCQIKTIAAVKASGGEALLQPGSLTRVRCIGALNERKFFYDKALSRSRGSPRCRHSVTRTCLRLHLLKAVRSLRPLTAAPSPRVIRYKIHAVENWMNFSAV